MDYTCKRCSVLWAKLPSDRCLTLLRSYVKYLPSNVHYIAYPWRIHSLKIRGLEDCIPLSQTSKNGIKCQWKKNFWNERKVPNAKYNFSLPQSAVMYPEKHKRYPIHGVPVLIFPLLEIDICLTLVLILSVRWEWGFYQIDFIHSTYTCFQAHACYYTYGIVTIYWLSRTRS